MEKEWSQDAELVRVRLVLEPEREIVLSPRYATGLHAWFLHEIEKFDPELSRQMHDGGTEKPFALSDLQGQMAVRGRQTLLTPGSTYDWSVAGLSKQMVQGIRTWLGRGAPERLILNDGPFRIREIQTQLPPLSYQELTTHASGGKTALSFLTPTSFRRKGHHLPLPLPTNVFGSYLRRWNDFSGTPVEQETFLNWVDESVVILRHRLESVKVTGGKGGMVTGFLGAVEFGLTPSAEEKPEFQGLFAALARLAPYCGTGHKTTFGLGHTVAGWQGERQIPPGGVLAQLPLAERVAELSTYFFGLKKRQGGERAWRTAQLWATIVARREFGEPLQAIAADLEMQYETVKSYAKIARGKLRDPDIREEPGQQDGNSHN